MYFLFWGIACVVSAVIAGRVAQRSGVALLPRLSLTGTASLAFAWGATLQFRLENHLGATAFLFPPGDVFESGHRLPMGLLAGGLVGFLGCRILRQDWGAIGDGLALGASIGIAIGRIGCLLNGCCSGLICDAFRGWICVPATRGSEAYGIQLASGHISPGAVQSLPVHPLALYFLAAAILTSIAVAVVLRCQRHSGLAGLTFLIVYSPLHFLLDHLRASTGGVPTPLSATVSLGALVVGVLALLRRLQTLREAAAES